ncbi:uncharacterized protein LOC114165611 [Vigna unguiculata]|uniref:uncharacterized protein LOC114165611 n=1 Tax=Vigna unguiculata TaxID=3917 RepID=UPI0010168BA5|nr:uncharacterized protein LOC114165611 [Vigna unguiculata]
MSSGDPPRPPPVDKGKGIAKTRNRRNNYMLRIPVRPITPTPGLHMPSLSSPPPPTGLHNPTSIPAIHMSSSSSQPPPTGLHTPIVAPRPPSVPPFHIPSSSSSAPHTGIHTPSTDIGASPSPHNVPSPASIGGPSFAVGQQSAPSPVAGDIVAPQPMVDNDLDAEPDHPLFVPSRVASQAITKTIKQQLLNPWPSWGSIPEKDKEIFWQRFKRRVQWAPEHEIAIKRNFNSRASHRLSELFRDARTARERPKWIPNDARELGRHVFLDEVFQQTHIRKGTGEYVDQRSRKTNEEFQTRLSQVRSEVSSCADGTQEQSSVDPTQDENIRTRCPNESLNQVPPSSSSNTEDLTNIRQQLSRSLEENEQLRSEFQSFQSPVLQYLPLDAQARLQQPQPRQPNLTQPNFEIPTPHFQ